MAAWTPAELHDVDSEHELRLSSRREDGSLREPVTIWTARVGNDVFVRAAYGPGTGWFRRAESSGRGHVEIGTVARDAAFEPADAALADAIDAAYHAKYDAAYAARIVDSVVSADARERTLRVVPE
jgi:hypothetical protein